MTQHNDPIRIPVDLTNPGQFFACCGLLELADRLWPGAEVTGHFKIHRFDRATLCISANESFSAGVIVKTFLGCERVTVDPVQPILGSDGKPTNDAKKTQPVAIGLPVNLRLNWWLDEIAGRLNAFKTWGAHKTSFGLIDDMANAIAPENADDNLLFRSPVGMTSRIGVDPRSSWNALDTGYSPNDQNQQPVDTYPAVELLAAVGLQTFSPSVVEDTYLCSPWEQPLPAIAARAAVSGILRMSEQRSYGFTVLSRGKFKFFSKAALTKRSKHV